MNKLKKLLYLLQLEEYDSTRYKNWLGQNNIGKLQEIKKKLKWTPRALMTLLFAIPFSVILDRSKAVSIGNNFAQPIFILFEEIIVFLAKIKKKMFPKLITITITGSYGKTTFKEMLSWVLKEEYSVLETPGNVNTRIGIARLILTKLKKNHEIFIVEAGAYEKGDIKKICALVNPLFGIITIIGWMHLERFGSTDKIRETKTEIIPFIKDKEKLFLPRHDHEFIDFEKTVSAIALSLGLSKEVIKKRLAGFEPPEHRLTKKNINSQVIVLDDAYNSNPLGFKKALQELHKYRGYQKIIVTPGMIELGTKQFILNKDSARDAADAADIFVIVGQTNLQALSQGVKEAKNKKCQILTLSKEENFETKIFPFFKPPTVILLENDLPDHYF